MSNIFKVCYIFSVTLIGLLLLFQQSVGVYWQQTYHQAMPLANWQEKPFFSSIAILNQHLLNEESFYFSIVKNFNNQIIEQYNYLVIGADLSQHHDEHINNVETQSTGVKAGDNDITNISSEDLLNSTQQERPIIIQLKDKILFIGDSLMQGVAPKVKRTLYQKYHIESLDLSKQSTGLSYPRAFNWPKTVEETLAQDPSIKLLVVFLGPNDPWNYPVKGQTKYLQFKSAQWEATYRYRINRILNAAKLNQTHVIWLGVPCMRKPKLHSDVLYLNTLYQSEVAKVNGHYLATSELLGCSDKEYANFIETSKGNSKVRIDDGIHFTVLGQRILANRIINEIIIESPNQNKAIQ